MSNKPTICEDCTHRINGSAFGSDDLSTCKKKRISYTRTSRRNFAYCTNINEDGNCAMFEPKVPLWRRIAAWVKGGAA